MKRFLLLIVVLLVGTFAFAGTETLTFDNLSDNGFGTNFTNYGGLTWSNAYVLNTPAYASFFGPSGYSNGTVSQPNVAFDGFGAPLTISAPGSWFIFNSGYITAAWNDGLDIQVDGYYKGVDVISGNFTIDTSGPTFFFATAPVKIDTLTFVSSGGTNHGYNGSGTHFALDNLNVTTVPEPSSLLLIGSGIVGLATRLRKRA